MWGLDKTHPDPYGSVLVPYLICPIVYIQKHGKCYDMKLRQLHEQIDETNPEQYKLGTSIESARNSLINAVYASRYDANKAKDDIITILSLIDKIPWGGPLGRVEEEKFREAIKSAGKLAYRTPSREGVAAFISNFGDSWYHLYIPKK